MTSTPYQVGLSDNTRSSSRVLRPPGGGHTDIFGGEPEPTRGRRPAPSVLAAAAAATAAGHGDEPAKPTNGNADASSHNGADSPQEHRTVPVTVPEPSVPMSKPNTPDESTTKADMPKSEPKQEAPKRARVPPGGFSSGLW